MQGARTLFSARSETGRSRRFADVQDLLILGRRRRLAETEGTNT
jgi:hypothetical protein